jgi:hypothetical protein
MTKTKQKKKKEESEIKINTSLGKHQNPNSEAGTVVHIRNSSY